jgi:hypothetical protein
VQTSGKQEVRFIDALSLLLPMTVFPLFRQVDLKDDKPEILFVLFHAWVAL